MDVLKEECGIVGVYQMGTAKKDRNVYPFVVRALLEMQNRGQLSAGITSYNPSRDRILQTHKEIGTVHEVFSLHNPHKSKRLMDEYSGFAAIGHNRYATSGSLDAAHAQPFERVHGKMWKWFAIAFNGNLANYDELKKELNDNGYHITYHSDTEVMMHSINRELKGDDQPDFKTIFKNVSKNFDGAYNIAFINGSGEMVVMRDPLGFKPLCYGVKDDLLVVASESVVLTNLGFESYTDVKPGEMVIANSDGYKVERFWPEEKKAYCFFEWIYFANLASNLEQRSVYKVRHAIGKEMAEMETLENLEDFIVISVPETANTVANSFGFHMGLPVVNGLLRNRYVGRTFIESNNRGENVRMKFTPLTEVIEGKKVFLVDDTLVRGTTLKTVIQDLRERGRVKEVHVRIGNPPNMGPCFYGIDMPTVKELFAPAYFNGEAATSGPVPGHILERMASDLGADSLTYLSIERLVKALDLPQKDLCMACVDSQYPTKTGRLGYAEAMKK